jgi:hypothetical protein
MGATYLSVTGGNLFPDFGGPYQGAPNGIPYYTVPGTQAKVAITFTQYGSQSDAGPYPLPTDPTIAPTLIEAQGGDHHVVVIDRDNLVEYDLWNAVFTNGVWSAASGAIFNLVTNTSRTPGWTSANAAGLPEYPGLVRYDEVVTRGVVNHAIAFTVSYTQQGFIAPATHASGTCGANPTTTLAKCMPMGARWVMSPTYSCAALSTPVQVLCTAMKKYGLILIDNGTNWALAGAPDPRWNDTLMGDLKLIPSSAFQMVNTGVITNL